MPDPTIIDVASGGILESNDGGELKIAVIHRARYDDWTLPKGHLEQGETIEEAAIREVEEETGCKGEITEIVPPIAYLADGQPKIVVYYRMNLVESGRFRPDEEVSSLDWISPAEATTRLTYDTERDLVSRIYSL